MPLTQYHEVWALILKVLLVLAIIFQLIASTFAVRLVRTTRYNSIWILFIVGFYILSGERMLQLIWLSTDAFPMEVAIWFGVVVSIALSIAVMFAHKLFQYISRMDRHRQLVNKRILTAALRAEEKSRSHFSKELHDGLGPLLSSAKMSLSAVSRDSLDEKQRLLIDNVSQVINEAIRSVREISNNMSPHILMNFGLARGVRNFIDKCPSISDVDIDFKTNLGSRRFDADVELILYRVICELINNSLKHSGCKHISLQLNVIDSDVRISYRDNGKGFDVESLRDCGMGLSNMESRIHSLGGDIYITSVAGEGMSTEISVKLDDSQ